MSDPAITIRSIDFARDSAALKAFVVGRDRMRLEHCEPAVADGDAFLLVADSGGEAVGWALVHTKYRSDQDWEPDPDTERFQSGDNAYLEQIEVTARMRSRGVGRQLIAAAQEEARRRGKKHIWLHTSENNVMAHRLFEREGWTHERTVNPPWKAEARTRIYKKEL